jgi:phage baseplate assembly protein W
MEDRPYLGKGWAFPPHFLKEYNTVSMVSDEEDIYQSLWILLSTLPGERVFRFDYGCDIKQWVFSEMSVSQKTLIADVIEQAVIIGEPRVSIENIEIAIQEATEGILEIQLYYRIKETNSRSNMVYPFYFKEGTDLQVINERM